MIATLLPNTSCVYPPTAGGAARKPQESSTGTIPVRLGTQGPPMPDPQRLPKHRHHKPKDLAVVRIDGHDVYLGRYDSPESREKYRRVVAECVAGAGVVPPSDATTDPGTDALTMLSDIKPNDSDFGE